jgi:cyclase
MRLVGGSFENAISQLQSFGAGELLMIDVDNDGKKAGLETAFLKSISKFSNIPVIGMGGVGNFSHLVDGFLVSELDAIACGTLFTFGDNNPIRARSYLRNQGIRVRR